MLLTNGDERRTRVLVYISAAIVLLLLVFLAASFHSRDGGPARQRSDQKVFVWLRGTKKSGTTWLEVVLLSSFTCFSHLSNLPADDKNENDTVAIPELTFNDYSRAASFYLDDSRGRLTEYRFDVRSKHRFSSWQYGENNRQKALRDRVEEVGLLDDEFFDDDKTDNEPNSVRELDVLVFRDPRDTAISKSRWHHTNELSLEFFAETTATMTDYFRATGFLPAMMHAHSSPKAPNTFFWSYEMSRNMRGFRAHLEALWDALELPHAHRLTCLSYVTKQASIDAMRAAEQDHRLPGPKNMQKVQNGGICEFAREDVFNKVANHVEWSLKGRLPDPWFHFFADPSNNRKCKFSNN